MTHEDIFTNAIGLPPEQRGAYLDEICAGDAELRARIDKLLRSHEGAGSFLASPLAVDLEATLPMSEAERKLLAGRASEQEGDILGPYKLREQIGEGGFGAVWVADQEKPVKRRVALKIIKLGMDTKEVIARFEQERQALAVMDHPNIAKVLDAGTTQFGRPFFVMELVRGIPITDYCDQNNLTTGERLELFAKVCHAVQHAHQKGIIHRDIKPSNILVTLYDGVPVPKVIDFGIAKATEGSLTDATIYTQLHQLVGTPAYMSPEQAEMSGLDMDTRSDIYSLGVLLYELLAGRTPFDARELMASGIDAMRKTIREQDPPRPSNRLATLNDQELTTTAKRRSTDKSHLLHQCRGDLDWIVMKCLEKDRRRRYETANGLAADITRHLANEPVTARPPSAAYRLQKSWRRNKIAYSAATVVSLTLVTGIVVSTWQAVQATRARAAAERQQQLAQAEAARANEAEKREAQQRITVQNERADERRRAYAADMLLCRRALSSNNLREARQLLESQLPKDGAEDLRGWEWRWLTERCKTGALFELGEQKVRVTQAIFVEGGKSIVSYEHGGAVRRIMLDSRRVETLQEQSDPSAFTLGSNSGFLCASQDRRWIGAVEMDNDGFFVRIWDLSSKSPPRKVAIGEERATAIAISPDGGTLAAYILKKNTAFVWDIASGERKPVTIKLDAEPKLLPSFGAVQFSPDGRTLAVAGFGGQVLFMNVETWTLKGDVKLAAVRGQGISSLAFSPDGRRVACGCVFIDPQVKILDVEKCTTERVLSGHTGFVAGLAFSPDGKTLASASADQTVKIWDVETWTERGTHLGHTDEVWSVDFSPDGAKVVSSGKDKRIEVWSATNFAERDASALVVARPLMQGTPQAAPSGEKIVSTVGGVVTLAGGAVPAVPSELGTNNVKAFWVAPDQIVAVSKAPVEIKVWNLVSNQVESFPMDVGTVEWVISEHLELSHLLVLLVPGEKTGEATVIRWDVTGRRKLSSCALAIRKSVQDHVPCFSQDGRRMAVSRFTSVTVCDIANETEEAAIAVPSVAGIQGMALSPDGKQLAVAQRDRPAIMIHDVDTGHLVTTLRGHNLVITKLQYSFDGTRLLSNTIGSEPVKLWSTRSWKEVARLEPPTGFYYATPRFTSDDHGILLFPYKFGNGWDGARLFRAPSWDEIAKAEASERE
ncbi:protein kinase [Prosthecobacter sp.]|uniref:protein kinase domain-containing protein n=1 Tax=Prosthecobacter sp. TaxID=1965333 RepID=UPI001DFB5226|nr:protein kinase [Prosthecobacter sp.]MCB1275559.1 protein kinase [Prosthecobacter sp.]